MLGKQYKPDGEIRQMYDSIVSFNVILVVGQVCSHAFTGNQMSQCSIGLSIPSNYHIFIMGTGIAGLSTTSKNAELTHLLRL